jgi:hypothetical protein
VNVQPKIALVHRHGPTDPAGAPSWVPAGRRLYRYRLQFPRSSFGPVTARDTRATMVGVPAGHLAMVSRPDEVVHLLETAAKTVQAARFHDHVIGLSVSGT